MNIIESKYKALNDSAFLRKIHISNYDDLHNEELIYEKLESELGSITQDIFEPNTELKPLGFFNSIIELDDDGYACEAEIDFLLTKENKEICVKYFIDLDLYEDNKGLPLGYHFSYELSWWDV